MADPFVSGAPEAEKDPMDGRAKDFLHIESARAFIPRGLFISKREEGRGINARCLPGVSHVLHHRPPPPPSGY